jgi:CPA1 family monovalent cation:H+ antiporter
MTPDLSHLGLLLLVSTLVAMLTRRLRMPYTVGLVLAGMGLHVLHVHLGWRLSKDLIFSLFLPPLVFEAALCIGWRELRADLPLLALLATLGVLLAAAATAAGMHYLLDWDWGSALVFGTLIAATDPVSVIAAFKEAGARGRLRLLIEAESLLNDGTAAVAFVAVLDLLAGGPQGAASIAGSLLFTIAGGIATGLAVGLLFMMLAGRTPDYLVEITLTTLAAYGSFLLAEHFRLSGVMAALTVGLVVGNARGGTLLTATGRQVLEPFWETLAFIANSLIFLLIGAQVAQQRFGGVWPAVIAAVVVVTAGRAAAVYPLCALFRRTRFAVSLRHQHLLLWGGLRGALALALALAVPEDLPRHDLIVTLTFAVVAFSVFAQGLTLNPLLRASGEI